MDSFDVDRYFNLLRMKGYEVKPKYDNKNGKLVGYTIGKNASVFKASAIGRRFMVSQLEATWKKMHPKPTQVKMRPAAPSVSSARTARSVAPKPTVTQPKVQPKVQPKPESQKTLFTINTGSETKQVWIPNSVKDTFLNEAQIPEGNDVSANENISHVAMLLFAGYIEQPHLCPFLAEVVAVHLPLVGARRMMRMTVSMLAVVSRWLMLCASHRRRDVHSTINQIPHINEKNKQYQQVYRRGRTEARLR